MLVRYLTAAAGPNVDIACGDVLEVSDTQAERLIARNMAERVNTPKPRLAPSSVPAPAEAPAPGLLERAKAAVTPNKKRKRKR